MLNFKLAIATVALLSVASSAMADPEGNRSGHLNDYHFQATLSDGSASLRSLQLPWPVVSNLLQEDLKDLQVYNEDHQAVPFTVRSVATDTQTQEQTRTLNFFPIGDIEKLGTILQQEANGERYKTVKLIQTGQRYLIIDNPKLAGDNNPLPLQRLSLSWSNLAHWLPKSLRIEASDDLTQWQSIAIEKLPYRMAENGVILENHELRFKQPVQKRFIRLSGAEDFEPLLKALETVSGHYQRTSISRPLNWNKVDLKATDTARQYHYELPPSLAVKRWRLEGLTPDSLYKGRLYTRSTEHAGNKPNDWRFSQDFLQYSIKMDDGLVSSEANQTTNRRWSREWRIDLEQDIQADALPKLALAWQSVELVFLAQGKGPFEIRFGSRTTQANTRMDLAELLRATTPEVVTVGAVTQLSKVTEKKDGKQYTYLLWSFLVAAFLMLLYMARGLLREMGS